MSKYEFAQLQLRDTDWMVRQYIMRAKFADKYAKNAKRVLDIASGSGYCTYHLALANQETEVLGLDVSDDAIEYASSTYKAPNLKFEKGDAFNLDYPDGWFDLIVTYETLEHVIDGDGFIKELARVTSHDGVLLCSTPNSNYDFPNKEHVKVYTPKELFGMLRNHFEEVEEKCQFQLKSDRQKELCKMRKRRIRNILMQPVCIALFLTPVWLKNKIKQIMGIEIDRTKHRQFVISNDQDYHEESVVSDFQRSDAYPYILVAVCKNPKIKNKESAIPRTS